MMEGEEKGLRYIEDSISVGNVEKMLGGIMAESPGESKKGTKQTSICVVQNLQMILED